MDQKDIPLIMCQVPVGAVINGRIETPCPGTVLVGDSALYGAERFVVVASVFILVVIGASALVEIRICRGGRHGGGKAYGGADAQQEDG